MLDGHEGFWRAVVALMLVALAGVAYLAYELRPRASVATELARNYKPLSKPAAVPAQAASDAPKPAAPAAVAAVEPPAAPAPVATRPEPSPAKPLASTGGVLGTPLRRFLPALGSGLDEAQLNFQLGVVLASLARHEEAVRAYSVATERAPQNSLSWIGLAVSFEALGKRREALDAYRRALGVVSIGAEDRAFAERRVRELQ